MERMENPPSLPELARTAGLNETKLKRGFRQLYGTSVFGYLRNQRLDKACMLLASGEMNVTEVPYAVGFSSPSHFTRMFTRHCGVKPKDYLRGFRHLS
jgi:AraC-like DNA-binding protein